ncbi:uncharacterized protein METZ01_LOCUS185064 [marine metagenome]|jgi:hypothetical protein|uniref:Uncharacterized protein n=1 Tax=marine metagenome TaxID=408172 RepID=A0A382D197_9ZZZZ|tara:strand:- start:244 stop:369 length:126 start_codon:yes stop_codon:yes gene_type:complete
MDVEVLPPKSKSTKELIFAKATCEIVSRLDIGNEVLSDAEY